MQVEIQEAKRQHVGQIWHNLREASKDPDWKEIRHKNLNQCFEISSYRKSWFVDGKLMAIGGVAGTLMSSTGFIWLAFKEEALVYRKQLVKDARKSLSEIFLTYNRLQTIISTKDPAAIRFAEFMGFRFESEFAPGLLQYCLCKDDLNG